MAPEGESALALSGLGLVKPLSPYRFQTKASPNAPGPGVFYIAKTVRAEP